MECTQVIRLEGATIPEPEYSWELKKQDFYNVNCRVASPPLEWSSKGLMIKVDTFLHYLDNCSKSDQFLRPQGLPES